MTHEPIEGEIIEQDATGNGTAVSAGELVPTQPQSLVGTNDPIEAVERLTKVADALKRVVDQKSLIARIQGKEYPLVGAWQTLGVLLGVTAITEWTRPIMRDDKVYGYEARVEVRTLDGHVVGAAESMCTREGQWARSDENALRSMAQTRATSKALRGPLGFVMQLAGYEATPAEEMPRGGGEDAPARPQATARPARETEAAASPAQRRLIFKTARDAGLDDERPMRAIFLFVAGTPHSDRIPASKVDAVLGAVTDHAGTIAYIKQLAETNDFAKEIVASYLTDEA